MASNRRVAAFNKTEYVLLRDGVNMIIRAAQAAGDDFKAVYAEDVRDHIQTVIDKWETGK